MLGFEDGAGDGRAGVVLAVGRRAAILWLGDAATSTAGAAGGGTWVCRHDKGCSTAKGANAGAILFLLSFFFPTHKWTSGGNWSSVLVRCSTLRE